MADAAAPACWIKASTALAASIHASPSALASLWLSCGQGLIQFRMYSHSGPPGGPRSPNSPSKSPVDTCSAPTRSPHPGGALPTSGGWAASAGGPPPSGTGGGAGARPGVVLPTWHVSTPAGGVLAFSESLYLRQYG